jgi:hypothetical protein
LKKKRKNVQQTDAKQTGVVRVVWVVYVVQKLNGCNLLDWDAEVRDDDDGEIARDLSRMQQQPVGNGCGNHDRSPRLTAQTVSFGLAGHAG